MEKRRKPQQQRALESRDRILDAAAQLFAERGVANTSTNRIAAHAGTSIGSLYRYFADKDEIVGALRARLLAAVEDRFTAAVLGSIALEPRAGIRASLATLVDALAEHGGLVQALTADITVTGSALDGLERRLQLLTRAYLLHHLGPRPDDELDARAFVMVSTGLAISLRAGTSAVDRELVVDQTAQMLAAWIEAAQARERYDRTSSPTHST